ncbi:NFX1-type zinc finger-containing protein 1-like [Tropilaelaps mercedesae]|uniref:NFX1-type zinc finger-containing protein 1-like n=1 Tax=Tropilaelaps mercedesae TaxID=418985 RepID=A0A1V9X4V1_9ACAR|nr:NFX1-type zinc finger-containing protein 1-like [Tropilaelaps mercedesae]
MDDPRKGDGNEDLRYNGVSAFANKKPNWTGRVRPGREDRHRDNDFDNNWRSHHQQQGARARQGDGEMAGSSRADAQRRQQQAFGEPQRQQRKKHAYPINDYKLCGLLHRPPNELVMELQLNPGWKCRLAEKTTMDVNGLSLVVKVFQKCLQSTNRHTLLAFVRESFSVFEVHLPPSVMFLIDTPSAPVAVLTYDLFELILAILAMLPKTTFYTAKTLVSIMKPHLNALQSRLAGKLKTLEELANEIERQVDFARAEEQANASERKPKRNIHGYIVSGAAPDDFREIDIFPTMDDIENERPFLRPNNISGPYKNGLEYLDTQFRLLREDFVKPLRDGIKAYLSLPAERRKKELKGQSVRYYWNVLYRGRIATLSDQMFAYALQLSPRDYKFVNWERSKRLANNAIIGLTSDDFTGVIFVVVVRRYVQMLQKGILFVECCRAEDKEYFKTGRVYSMIESTAVFEAYRYNLRQLQQIDIAAVPFEKYIVHVQKNIEPLQLLRNDRTINLKHIMVGSKSTDTVASNPLKWPSQAQTVLDDSQYRAVQSAFLRELCIIQGPPGTGKTFVGQLIIKIMLRNYITCKPILVVCYTNHALDQFVEGILNFTERVVRVGGRCKNEVVNEYNLSELRLKRQGYRIQKENARFVRYRVDQLRRDINRLQQVANEALRKPIPDDALDTFSLGLFKDQREVLPWLGVEKRIKEFIKRERKEVRRQAREEKRATVVQGMQQNAQDHEQNDCQMRENAFRMMAEEYQSDEDVEDEEDEEKNLVDGDRRNQSAVMERLLDLNQQWRTCDKDRYFEFELTASKRPRLTEADALQLHHRLNTAGLTSLKIDQRWDLYREAFQSLKEMEAELDLTILGEAKIIAMTTTGAAKYKSLYERLALEVVIVEEAAELLESHIVTALSPSTKQLILIGDHQQLRPTTTDYTLTSKFHLDISLFERLINNQLPYVRLQKQHRMRPEFIQLLVPHIYPSLENHERVLNYPHVRGMEHDLQFMQHTHLETHDSENRSKSNLFECKIVVGLVNYLLNNGYPTKSITVLTMYSGQQFMIKGEIECELERRKSNQQPVRVTSVDNYQGEENDIVIVSFVRSNMHDTIGFLKTLNRLCVAFSRARHGLFCVGNLAMIASKQKKFENILESIKASVHDHLKLRCDKHKRVTKIKDPDDFRTVAEGGCGEPCDYRLNCGHTCPHQCHGYDDEHNNVCCRRPFSKKFPECGHTCDYLCDTPFYYCTIKVTKKLVKCGHLAQVECGIPLEKIECESKCERLCGEPCTPCMEQCLRECVHQSCQALCSENCTRGPCEQPCPKKLECGHPCIGYCTDKCPSKCRTCQGNDNLADVVLGTESEESRYVELDCGHVVEASGMAMWVKTSLETTDISMGGITCPACNAAVKKTNRYIQHINAKRRLIEQVFGSPLENAKALEELKRNIRLLIYSYGSKCYSSSGTSLDRSLRNQIISERNPDQMKIRQWTNLSKIVRRVDEYKRDLRKFPALSLHWEALQEAVHVAIRSKIGQQQMDDICMELLRFSPVSLLAEELDHDKDNPELKECVQMLTALPRFSEEQSAKVRRLIFDVRKKRTKVCLGIDDSERVMVLKAMALRQGHWYACPNGHVYCITECGGAMMESKCNECGATIGGQRHALRSDNEVATGMDGATHSAWPGR